NHYLAAVISRNRTHHVTKILKARHQAAGRRGGMTHFLRDRRHGENVFWIEEREKKKLHKGDVARREFLTETQQETTLHLQNEVGKPLRIRTNLIGRSSCKRGEHSRIQAESADKAR